MWETVSRFARCYMQLKRREVGVVGRIEKYAASTPPQNTIKANGAELSRVLFWRLWKHAQESGNLVDQSSKDKGNFGTGDGSTTFTIPDHRGVVGRGFDDGAGLDSAPTLGRYQADNNKSHNHSMNGAGSHNHSGTTNTTGNHSHSTTHYVAIGNGGSYPVGFGSVGGSFGVNTNTTGNHAHSFTTSTTGNHTHTINASGAAEATMKNTTFLYCIRYQ